jgi:hypothetical protein
MSKQSVWLRCLQVYCSVYIPASQLVKHFRALPHGRQLAVAAEVATSYAVVEVPESSD